MSHNMKVTMYVINLCLQLVIHIPVFDHTLRLKKQTKKMEERKESTSEAQAGQSLRPLHQIIGKQFNMLKKL